MIQHRTKICSLNNTKSLGFELSWEQPNATCTKLLGHHALIVAHIAINMNLNISWHVSKNQKKGQNIKTLTLEWKMKCHYTKRNDYVLVVGKQ
jgi:hypothetical protein